MDGRASGRVTAREAIVGTFSKVEEDIERLEGRFSRVIVVVGALKPGLTGTEKSIEVVHRKCISGLQNSEIIALAFIAMLTALTFDFIKSRSDGNNRYKNVTSSRGRHLIGKVMLPKLLRSSTVPSGTVSSTDSMKISLLTYGVISTSRDAMTEGRLGVLFGFAYLTRALKAGAIRNVLRDTFLKGLIKSLATLFVGTIRETLWAESQGLVDPSASSLEKESRRLSPAGILLCMYSSSLIPVATCSSDFRFAVAAKVIDGLCGRRRWGLLRKTDSFHTTKI